MALCRWVSLLFIQIRSVKDDYGWEGELVFSYQYLTFGLMGLMGGEFGYALCRFRRFQLFGCIPWEGIWHFHYIGFRLFAY